MYTYPVMVKDIKAGMVIFPEYGLPVVVEQVRQPSIDSDYVDIHYHVKDSTKESWCARVYRLAVYEVSTR